MKIGRVNEFAAGARRFYARFSWPGEIFVFAAALFLYLPLQSGSSFADPDALYHIKIAELIAAHGPVRDFFWLPFSTLANSFADQHFLYHVALVPFIKAMGPLQGAKFATAVFSAGAIAALAWAMRYLGVRYAPIFALLAAIMNPLAFRIGLTKASAFGVAVLIIGLAFAVKRRPWPLVVVAFAYVWTHGSWPTLLGLGTAAIMIMTLWRAGEVKRSCISLLALWGGALAGIVINPYFPKNLHFYWEQIVQIALVNYQSRIGVGSEWYPYAPDYLAATLPLLAIIVAVAFVAFPFVLFRKNGEDTMRVPLALSVGAFVFLVMTLRSQRHVEYFVPLATMAAASWISALGAWDRREFWKKNIVALALASCAALAMLGFYGTRGLEKAKRDLSGGYSFGLYRRAAAYLKEHAAPGENIVHADWDDMPSLMYWDDANRYIMGLDPTFTYRAGEKRYWDYVNFTLGKSDDPVSVMRELNARYVFMDNEHHGLVNMLNRSGRFVKVYGDEEAQIFLLK